jgi:hypothetical protein
MVGRPERLRVPKLSIICKELGQSGHFIRSPALLGYTHGDADSPAMRAKTERYNDLHYFWRN